MDKAVKLLRVGLDTDLEISAYGARSSAGRGTATQGATLRVNLLAISTWLSTCPSTSPQHITIP